MIENRILEVVVHILFYAVCIVGGYVILSRIAALIVSLFLFGGSL